MMDAIAKDNNIKNVNNEYDKTQDDIKKLIKDIQFELEADAIRQRYRPSDWGYVGSIKHIKSQLLDVYGFITS
jgi:hypothetical protein